MKPTRTLLIGMIGFCASQTLSFATDRHWSGASGSSNNIDQGANWTDGSPNSGDSLYFEGTSGARHTANSNYGTGSYFDTIMTKSGAGGIIWTGDNTYANKFENNNDSNLFKIESNIGNRSSPDYDIELNPVGAGGVQITGTVTITGDKQIKVYGDKTLTLDGVVSGSGASLAIQNSATVVMSGNNTYTGNTWGNAGTLVINGDQTGATGVVSIGSGGKLAGAGTIGGATSIESGGKYSAGAIGAIGTQNFTRDLSLKSGSIFEWDLTAESESAGFDTVNGASGQTFDSTGAFRVIAGLDFTTSFWDAQRTWSTIITGFGTSTGWAPNTAVSIYDSGGTFRDVSGQGAFTVSGTSLSWVPVPEPTNLMAGLLLAAGLMRRKRN